MNTLITITFSHYCEKARWALELRGIPFVEEGHLPILHRPATQKVGGTSTPVLVVPGAKTLTDSTDILHFCDREGSHGPTLFPPDLPEVASLEDQFDEVLGPHARRLAYYELLQDDAALRALVQAAAVPRLEKTLAPPLLPIFKMLLRKALKITPESAKRSEGKVDGIFDEVEKRLSDGRKFLAGDRFTAADLTFASLAAPLILPPSYQKYLIPMDRLSAPVRALVDRYRNRKAGEFAMRMSETERSK